jgi:hypothetical protein
MDAAKGIGDDQTPLVRALIGLTVMTGLVDAISFLGLGHIFTANMTGNLVFLGFAAVRLTSPRLVRSPHCARSPVGVRVVGGSPAVAGARHQAAGAVLYDPAISPLPVDGAAGSSGDGRKHEHENDRTNELQRTHWALKRKREKDKEKEKE